MRRPFIHLLAGLFTAGILTLTAASAQALPPGGAGPNTPGTASSVGPGKIAPGGRISFSISGFPARETLYIKINDGDLCSDSSHGACVYHTQRIGSKGSTSGYFDLPGSLKPGRYWLRFLASAYIDADDPGKGIKGFTRRSATFTVVAPTSTNPGTSSAPQPGTTKAPVVSQGARRPVTSGGVVTATPGPTPARPSSTPSAPAASAVAAAEPLQAYERDGATSLALGSEQAGEWFFVRADGRDLGWFRPGLSGTIDLPRSATEVVVLDADAAVVGSLSAASPTPPVSTLAASPSAAPASTSPEPPAAPVLSSAAGITLSGSVLVAVASLGVGALLRRRVR